MARKNEAYLKRRLPGFLRGDSWPDFPVDHFEADFIGRVRQGDLTPLGRAQLRFELES